MAEEKETADPDVTKDPTSLLESYINDLDTANDDDRMLKKLPLGEALRRQYGARHPSSLPPRQTKC